MDISKINSNSGDISENITNKLLEGKNQNIYGTAVEQFVSSMRDVVNSVPEYAEALIPVLCDEETTLESFYEQSGLKESQAQFLSEYEKELKKAEGLSGNSLASLGVKNEISQGASQKATVVDALSQLETLANLMLNDEYVEEKFKRPISFVDGKDENSKASSFKNELRDTMRAAATDIFLPQAEENVMRAAEGRSVS